MIELVPNWHPVWVHFTVGLLGGGVIFYLLATIGRNAEWGRGALAASRWSIGAGIVFAVLALLTGWWAMNSVAHDDPAHANMIVHRNWAFGTAAVFLLVGAWMLLRRGKQTASIGVLLLSLVAFAGLTVTGYEGGENVFEHGLGVQRLPDTGEHDHAAHGHGGEEPAAGRTGDTATADGHAHDEGDEHADDESPSGTTRETQVAEDEEHDHGAHDHGESPEAGTSEAQIETGGLADRAQALSDAIAAGNRQRIRNLLAEDVLIFEGGGAERSLEEYASHHMGSDMAFIGAVNREVLERRAFQGGKLGSVATRTRLTGNYQDQEIDMVSTETLVFERRDGKWKIVHIHWASGS